MKFFILIFLLIGKNLAGPQCDNIDETERFDCFPENGGKTITDLESFDTNCSNRGCCWELPNQSENFTGKILQGVPACYFPKEYPSYEVISSRILPNGNSYSIEKRKGNNMPNEILNLEVLIFYETKERLRIKIIDPNSRRYEVPVFKLNKDNKLDGEFNGVTDYQISVNRKPFFVKVYRKSTGNLMLFLKRNYIFQV